MTNKEMQAIKIEVKDKTGNKQPPVTSFPIFLCLPDFVVGMPVLRAKFDFAFEMPKARLAEKETPGILKPFFLAILNPP